VQLNFKSLKEGQGKAVEGYISDQYVFVYLRTRSELLGDLDHFRELGLDLSKRNRAVPEVCVIVALLVDLMNDQVTSLQRRGISANLHRPFYRLYRVESSARSMKDWLRLRFSTLFNQESFTELTEVFPD